MTTKSALILCFSEVESEMHGRGQTEFGRGRGRQKKSLNDKNLKCSRKNLRLSLFILLFNQEYGIAENSITYWVRTRTQKNLWKLDNIRIRHLQQNYYQVQNIICPISDRLQLVLENLAQT